MIGGWVPLTVPTAVPLVADVPLAVDAPVAVPVAKPDVAEVPVAVPLTVARPVAVALVADVPLPTPLPAWVTASEAVLVVPVSLRDLVTLRTMLSVLVVPVSVSDRM